MSAGEHSAPVVEEPPQRAATPSHSAKQMGRDPDTGPMMLNIKGYFDRRSAVGVRSNTMVSGDLCGASAWCGGGKMCPTLFRNYLRTGASTRRGLCTHAQLAEARRTDPEIGVQGLGRIFYPMFKWIQSGYISYGQRPDRIRSMARL